MELIQGKADKQPSTNGRSTPQQAVPAVDRTEGTLPIFYLIAAGEESKMMADAARLNALSIRCNKFKALTDLPNVDVEALRKLSWSGIPDEIRPMVWKLMMV